MVIVIHQAASTGNSMSYNEKKVGKKKASFFGSKNTPTINPFVGSAADRLAILKDIEDKNTRVKKKGLHISVNPSVSDMIKLGETGIRTEIDNLMEHLGYGDQPYFVYKHADLERTHFHIVSTRIDRKNGKKINDGYEKEKVQRFIRELEQKHDLSKDNKQEQTGFYFSASSSNLKNNLESLFYQLNRLESITSKELYDKSLALFNVEIRKSGGGHVVLITDGDGNAVRYPMKLSNFQERPRFYVSQNIGRQNVLQMNNKFQMAQWARDLNKLIKYGTIPEQADKEQRVKRKKRGRFRRF